MEYNRSWRRRWVPGGASAGERLVVLHGGSFAEASDTSQAQFALLGLWAAQRAGVEVSPEVWQKAGRWFLSSQREDGGSCIPAVCRHGSTKPESDVVDHAGRRESLVGAAHLLPRRQNGGRGGPIRQAEKEARGVGAASPTSRNSNAAPASSTFPWPLWKKGRPRRSRSSITISAPPSIFRRICFMRWSVWRPCWTPKPSPSMTGTITPARNWSVCRRPTDLE